MSECSCCGRRAEQSILQIPQLLPDFLPSHIAPISSGTCLTLPLGYLGGLFRFFQSVALTFAVRRVAFCERS